MVKQNVVLVVDDEPMIRRLISKLLSGKYKILEAQNGQMAVDMAGEQKPDIVLMDMMMPGMDGLTACYKIKTQDATGKIRVVMLTAVNQELNKKLSLSVMKADGYITKPFEEENLLKTLEGMLATAR
jgi:CheY-like chemotaxis protein